MAFTAGRTVFTPTSHGNSKQSPDYRVIYGEIYLKLTIVILGYDACHDGALENTLNSFCTTNRFYSIPVMAVSIWGENIGKRINADKKRRKQK